jgi:RNA polymerase sigma-70 factor (ECF subfamily)
MTHHVDDAEDLTQEAVLHAWRAYRSFREGSNFKAWLFRICMNAYIDGYRSRRNSPVTLPLLDTDLHEGDAEPRAASPEASVVEAMLDGEIEAALRALPDIFRAAVVLSDLDGMTYEEVAAVLCVPVGTVRSRLFRGRSLMRSALQDYAVRRGIVEGLR